MFRCVVGVCYVRVGLDDVTTNRLFLILLYFCRADANFAPRGSTAVFLLYIAVRILVLSPTTMSEHERDKNSMSNSTVHLFMSLFFLQQRHGPLGYDELARSAQSESVSRAAYKRPARIGPAGSSKQERGKALSRSVIGISPPYLIILPLCGTPRTFCKHFSPALAGQYHLPDFGRNS